MNQPLRSSTLRVGIAAGLAGLSILALVIVLPQVSDQQAQHRRARQNAEAALQAQKDQLQRYQTLSDNYRKGREIIQRLSSGLPSNQLGELQWTLSRTLHDLAAKHSLRITQVKYGAPNREASKGTGLETIDVETALVGVYPTLKAFMLDLEKSGVPFSVSAVRLEETPEGARLSLTLRAFRQVSTTPQEAEG